MEHGRDLRVGQTGHQNASNLAWSVLSTVYQPVVIFIGPYIAITTWLTAERHLTFDLKVTPRSER